MKHLPIQWFGGKFALASWIHEHMPEHDRYVDVFGGGASVLLLKEPVSVETYNDLDGELVNFWRVVRDEPERLAEMISQTPHSRAEYWAAVRGEGEAVSDLERARRFAVMARQSMAGAPCRAWSSVVEHSRRGMASSCSRWLNMPAAVMEASDRLRCVQIENQRWQDLVSRHDGPRVCFYCDPPYMDDVRQAGVYRCEMSASEHPEMLRRLCSLEGAVVLSGYPHPLYDEMLSGWTRVDREVACRSAVAFNGSVGARSTRTEVLWIKGSGPVACADEPGLLFSGEALQA